MKYKEGNKFLIEINLTSKNGENYRAGKEVWFDAEDLDQLQPYEDPTLMWRDGEDKEPKSRRSIVVLKKGRFAWFENLTELNPAEQEKINFDDYYWCYAYDIIWEDLLPSAPKSQVIPPCPICGGLCIMDTDSDGVFCSVVGCNYYVGKFDHHYKLYQKLNRIK